MTGSGATKQTDLQAEYEHAVKQGNAIIKKIQPVEPSKQSIADIHYWYRYAAGLLIQKGDPKHKIAGKLYEDFEQFYGERHIRRILKEGGINLPEPGENGQMSENDSSLNTVKVLPENKAYNDMLTELGKAINAAQSKMDKPFCSLLDQKLLHEEITLGKGLAKMALDEFDDRQLVATPTQPLFLHCATDFTLQHAYGNYLLTVKDHVKKLTADAKIRGIRTLEEMTSKQANRTLYLRVKELHESIEPASVHEARMKGFSGQECPKCHCLRCERVPDSSEGRWYKCARCEHEFEGVIIPAYTRGVVMDEEHSTASA